jgi:hypothetical protein
MRFDLRFRHSGFDPRRSACARRIRFWLREGARAQGQDLRFHIADCFRKQLTSVHWASSYHLPVFRLDGNHIGDNAAVEIDGAHRRQFPPAGCGGEEQNIGAAFFHLPGDQGSVWLRPVIGQTGVVSEQDLAGAILEGLGSDLPCLRPEHHRGHPAT